MLLTLSAIVKRFHDIGKRGKYIFVSLIPFFEQITLFAYLIRDSITEADEFGPSSKYIPFVNNSTLQTPSQNNMVSFIQNDNNSINNISNGNIILLN